MTSTLLDQLAQFDRMKGKDPIDSTVIQEDYAETPVVPPPPYQVPDDLDPALINDPDDDFSEPEPSPLIPRVSPAPRMPQDRTSPPQTSQVPDLVVFGRTASYKGRDVELSEAEHKQVIRLVLGAVARTVSEQLAEVGVKRVRRRADTPSVSAAPEVKPKRGRPKKEA
jgi:hypothetical protein